MKNRTMMITAGFGLMMMLSLCIGSVGVMADSVGVPGAPAAAITSVTISSPANNSYLATNDVLVEWTSVPALGIWNLTRMWNETGGWGDWINVTDAESHLYADLADGLHYVEVNSTSFDDPVGMVANATFTVDTVAPTIAVSYPPEYTNDNVVNATWTTNGTGSPIDNVELTVTNVTGTFDFGPYDLGDVPNAILSVQIGSVLADGVWNLTLNVTDMAGNYAVEEYSFTVDTVDPTIAVTYPPEYINDNEVNATWTTNGTGSPIDNVELTVTNVTGTFDFGPYDLGDVPNAVLSDLIGSVLADGPWNLTLNVTDMAGNYAVEEYSFTVDTMNPVVAVVLPFVGQTNYTNFTISWTYTDATPQTRYNITIWNATDSWSLNATGAADLAYVADIVGSDLAEGAYTVNVRVWDSALNTGISDDVNFSIGPVVEFTTPPVVNIWYTNDQNFSVVWEVSIVEGVALDSQTLSIENQTGWVISVLLAADVREYAIWDLTGFNLTDGNWTVMIEVADVAGFNGTDSQIITVDTVAPEVVFVLPNGAVDPSYINDNNFTIEWTYVFDPLGTPIASQVVTVDNGTTNMTMAVDPANRTVSIYDVWGSVLVDGSYTIYILATDAAGNIGMNESANFVIDTVDPTLVITYPPEMINENLVNASWVANGTGSAISSIMLTLTNDTGSFVFGPFDVSDVSNATLSDLIGSVLADGIWTLSLNVTDMAGNYAVVEQTFAVEAVSPTVVSFLPESGAIVAPNAVVKVTFSEAMNQTSVVFTGITGTMTWNTAGTEVTLTNANLTQGTVYNVAVSGTDLAGNSLTGTTNWTFTVLTQVTGTVQDSDGNPIANATVKLMQGTTVVVEGVTDANGEFALLVDGGVYNLTIAATGFEDFVRTNQTYGIGQNNTLGVLTMTSVVPTPTPADYTLLIVGVVVVLAIIVGALYLFRRRRV